MIYFGRTTQFGTTDAPALFTGDLKLWVYTDELQARHDTDGDGEIVSSTLHGRKCTWRLEGEVTNASTDFLDLSSGPEVALSGAELLAGGRTFCTRAVETWRLGARKTIAASGVHYPDMGAGGSGDAGTLSAFTPAQGGLGIVYPVGGIVEGVYGLTHAQGLVNELVLTQEGQLTESPETAEGDIVAAAWHGFMRTINLKLLAVDGLPPETGGVLTITGAPAHAANFRITRAVKTLATLKDAAFDVDAFWHPGLAG